MSINNTPYNPFNSKDNDRLPNGYNKSDYYRYGFSDADIELWGMDQPSAPEPYLAWLASLDMADGDMDGNFDFEW